jgi:hypothetical protein
MKRLLVAALALCLAACTGGQINSAGTVAAGAADAAGLPAPATVADKTTLDEEGLLRLERLYKATRTAVEMAVDAGVIHGAVASRIAAADNKAFHLLGLARSAYDTGNAATYTAAVAQAQAAISDIWGDQ